MPRWTVEARERQRHLIQQWQPWKSSTGPQTATGKRRAKMNSRKHGYYDADAIELRRMIWYQKRILRIMASAFHLPPDLEAELANFLK